MEQYLCPLAIVSAQDSFAIMPHEPEPQSLVARGRTLPRGRAFCGVSVVLWLCGIGLSAAAEPSLEKFHHDAQPLLERYCYDCHGDGTQKGGVTLDEFKQPSD